MNLFVLCSIRMMLVYFFPCWKILDFIAQRKEVIRTKDHKADDTPNYTDNRKWWCEAINNALAVTGKNAVLDNGKTAMKALHATLQTLESKLKNNKHPFLDDGETPTVIDCSAFPFVWRLANRFKLYPADYPKLMAWLASCQRLNAFRNSIVQPWWWWW